MLFYHCKIKSTDQLFFIFSKSINFSVPNTIDERSLNKGKTNIYEQLENHELALRSAESIGCVVINVRPSDIQQGKANLILGLTWQVIKVKFCKRWII